MLIPGLWMTPKLSPPQLKSLREKEPQKWESYNGTGTRSCFIVDDGKTNVHEETAADTRVRTEARDIIVETVWHVVALVVVEREEQARATKVGVSAEEHVAIGVL